MRGLQAERRGGGEARGERQHADQPGGLSVRITLCAAPTTARAADVDYKAVAADIAKIIESDPDKGPTFLRLAWHSSGDYSKQAQDGGSRGGTIRFKEELAHGGNALDCDTKLN